MKAADQGKGSASRRLTRCLRIWGSKRAQPNQCTKFRRDVKLVNGGKGHAEAAPTDSAPDEGNPLPLHYKDHPLSGDWEHHRDCHNRTRLAPALQNRRQRPYLSEQDRTRTCSESHGVRSTLDRPNRVSPSVSRSRDREAVPGSQNRGFGIQTMLID